MTCHPRAATVSRETTYGPYSWLAVQLEHRLIAECYRNTHNRATVARGHM